MNTTKSKTTVNNIQSSLNKVSRSYFVPRYSAKTKAVIDNINIDIIVIFAIVFIDGITYILMAVKKKKKSV